MRHHSCSPRASPVLGIVLATVSSYSLLPQLRVMPCDRLRHLSPFASVLLASPSLRLLFSLLKSSTCSSKQYDLFSHLRTDHHLNSWYHLLPLAFLKYLPTSDSPPPSLAITGPLRQSPAVLNCPQPSPATPCPPLPFPTVHPPCPELTCLTL